MKRSYPPPSPTVVLSMILSVLLAPPAYAQDPFEIHVYEYESLKPGAFTLETHLNYVGVGPKTAGSRLVMKSRIEIELGRGKN